MKNNISDLDFGLLKSIPHFVELKNFLDFDLKKNELENLTKVLSCGKRLQEKIKIKDEFKMFKTHSAIYKFHDQEFTNKTLCDGFIYIVRDPRNVVSSWANHLGCDINSAIDIMKNYDWPGNIRELENVIEHVFVIETSQSITVNSLPEALKKKISDSMQ